MAYDPGNPDPEVIRIRNDFTLDREQKTDALFAWLASLRTSAPDRFTMTLYRDNEPLETIPGPGRAFASREDAVAALAQFCREMWAADEAGDKGAMDNLSDDCAIELYFVVNNDETYSVDKVGSPPDEDGLPRGSATGSIMMAKSDGKGGAVWVQWEPEVGRKWMARVFLD